jgi:hypothetical protein
MKLLLFLFFSLVSSVQLFSKPASVVVIRHGEKPKDREARHLSAAGEERARRLVDFVKNNSELARIGTAQILIATHPTEDGGGLRTRETLVPLSDALKVPIETPYESDHPKRLASMLLSDKKYDGKTILICWTHEHIPALIRALGIQPAPPEMGDDVYDLVYVISYGEDKGATLQILHQEMPSAPPGKKWKSFRPGKPKG